jgi:hypothetical protein
MFDVRSGNLAARDDLDGWQCSGRHPACHSRRYPCRLASQKTAQKLLHKTLATPL